MIERYFENKILETADTIPNTIVYCAHIIIQPQNNVNTAVIMTFFNEKFIHWSVKKVRLNLNLAFLCQSWMHVLRRSVNLECMSYDAAVTIANNLGELFGFKLLTKGIYKWQTINVFVITFFTITLIVLSAN